MEHLPDEMKFHILAHASPTDLALRWGVLSKSWSLLARDEHLWLCHLERRYPDWRTVIGGMGIDIGTLSRRGCFRLMSPHDPAERREGCCEHDLTKGAVCSCCTCRRYHSDRRWKPGSPEVVEVEGTDDEVILAKAYDGNVMRCYDGVLFEDEDRCWEAVAIGRLEDDGVLQRRTLPDGTEALSWTEQAHRSFRPPFQSAAHSRPSVTYDDAHLFKLLTSTHPELRDRSIIDDPVCRDVLTWFDDDAMQTITEVCEDAVVDGWDGTEFTDTVTRLIETGWLWSYNYMTAFVSPHAASILSEEAADFMEQ